jgi:hypothetical protein
MPPPWEDVGEDPTGAGHQITIKIDPPPPPPHSPWDGFLLDPLRIHYNWQLPKLLDPSLNDPNHIFGKGTNDGFISHIDSSNLDGFSAQFGQPPGHHGDRPTGPENSDDDYYHPDWVRNRGIYREQHQYKNPFVDPNTGRRGDEPLDKTGKLPVLGFDRHSGATNPALGNIRDIIIQAIDDAQKELQNKLKVLKEILDKCIKAGKGSNSGGDDPGAKFEKLLDCLTQISDPSFAEILLSNIGTQNLQTNELIDGINTEGADAYTHDSESGRNYILFDLDHIYEKAHNNSSLFFSTTWWIKKIMAEDMFHEMMHFCSFGNANDIETPKVEELDAMALTTLMGFSVDEKGVSDTNYDRQIKGKGGNYFSWDPVNQEIKCGDVPLGHMGYHKTN